MQRTSLSITAYNCRICEKRKNENLLELEEEVEDKGINLEKLLIDYSKYIANPQIGKNSNRSIGLTKQLQIDDLGDYKKISIYSEAGKLGEDFTVYNHEDLTRTNFSGDKNAAMYFQRTYCFINKKTKENIFIFFRYGLGGCKTAFQETLNQFLSTKKQIAHFDIKLSSRMFDDTQCIPDKLTLLTHYVPKSSDSAENIKTKPKKQISKETIIHLDSPDANNICGFFKNIVSKKPTLDELRDITIKDNVSSDFDEAMVTLKIGKASRKIKVQDFTGTIAEYDITNKVEYYEDGKRFKEESLNKIVNEYAFSFFDKGE